MPCRRAAWRPPARRQRWTRTGAAKIPPVWNHRTPCRPNSRPSRCRRAQLGGSGVAAVGASRRAPRTPKPRSVKLRPLRAVRPMPSSGDPLDEGVSTPPVQDEILDQPADLVVDEGGDDGGAQAEAAAQAAGDVVLAAALPRRELTGRADAALAGIQPEHDLAERHCVPPAFAAGRRSKVTLPLMPRPAGNRRTARRRCRRCDPSPGRGPWRVVRSRSRRPPGRPDR